MSSDLSKCNTIVNVRNFSEDMTDEQLKAIFSHYGTVKSCKIMVSSNVQCGRFAYVAFEDPDAAEEAIIELNCQEFSEGRRIYLHRTGEKIVRQPKVKKNPENSNVEKVDRCEIFVRNLDPEVNAEDLRLKFRHCGVITSAKIIMQDRRSKGFGFVSFETHEAAKKAVAEMNGRVILGKSIFVALATGTDYNKNSRGIRRFDDRRNVGSNPTASAPRPLRLLELAAGLRSRARLFDYGDYLFDDDKHSFDGDDDVFARGL